MSRFYVSPDTVKNGKIYMDKQESHHIIDVMRLKEGDGVNVFDGTGKEYVGRIESLKNKSVVINIEDIKNPQKKKAPIVILAQALLKKDKMDYIVQKATELGVSEIIPIETERTIVKSDEGSKEHKAQRWHKIIIEAAKQCGRSDLPALKNIIFFSQATDFFKEYDAVIMPCLADKTVSLKAALAKCKKRKKVLLLIGPEGDFSPKEIEQARESGAHLVSLGKRILRSDTAALSTLAIINFALEN